MPSALGCPSPSLSPLFPQQIFPQAYVDAAVGDQGCGRRRGIGCGTPEETGDRKSNRLEGGMALKISWRCGLLSWSLEEEELSREGEGADFQVQKWIRAGTPRFEI